MWTLLNFKLGSFHKLTRDEAEEAKKFYHMFEDHMGIWKNGRGDFYLWEVEMGAEEVAYRLQAMATMCIFKDACGHDLSQEEIKKYNEAKDIAIKCLKQKEKIETAIGFINEYIAQNENRAAGAKDALAMLKGALKE